MEKYIHFDYKNYKQLKKAYKQAVKEEKELMLFRKQEFVTAYVKYLLEYLESKGIKDRK